MDEPSKQQRKVLIGVMGVVAVAAIVLAVVVVGGGDDDDGATTTTTGEVTTTTSSSLPPSSTTTIDPAVLDVTVYPDLGAGTRFPEPVALVRSFATELLGFDTDVVVGPLAQGDSRSGEIEIHPPRVTAITTVLVRQIDDDSWVVLGATTESIRLDEPAAGATIRSPQPLAGSAYAFEGHVDVALLPDGENTPMGTTFVTGRGDGILGDFEGQLRYEVPEGVTRGVLVLSSPNGDDGTTTAATAIRVKVS